MQLEVGGSFLPPQKQIWMEDSAPATLRPPCKEQSPPPPDVLPVPGHRWPESPAPSSSGRRVLSGSRAGWLLLRGSLDHAGSLDYI